jgi:uncharacterized LabA/DUF88 family protein
MRRRAIAYIDGFNLYFGLRSSGLRRLYWLDLPSLVRSLLKEDQELEWTHYFTARIRVAGHNVSDAKRQSDYLDALGTLDALSIHYGHYLPKSLACRSCQQTWTAYEEKMTDVNIAVQLLADAYDDKFDVALLISADSDLTTPVGFVRKRFPDKSVVVAQPPGRNSQHLSRIANHSFTIGEAKFRQSQLPESVTTPSGFVISRPAYWK